MLIFFSSAVNSCQSAIKLSLQKLLNLTHLSLFTLNKALLNLPLKVKLRQKFNLRTLTNIQELDLIFALVETWQKF